MKRQLATMNRGRGCRYYPVTSLTSRPGAGRNDPFSPIDCPFAAFPRLRTLRWLPVFAALAVIAAPGTAEAAPRGGKSLRAYDGTWNVVFATTRGDCSSGYSVPFTVTGSRVSSAGGGRVSGSVNRAGAVAVNVSVGASRASGGGRLDRHLWRGRMAWHHRRRPLQRHLAGDAELSAWLRGHGKRKRPVRSDRPLHIQQSIRLSAAPAPSRPGGLRNVRPARPWRTRRHRP